MERTVKRSDFEEKTIELWVKTRIPLTTAHLQYHSGAPRKNVEQWCKELLAEDFFGIDGDHPDEMAYEVVGAHRAKNGPKSFEEMEKMDSMKGELVVAKRVAKGALAATGGESVWSLSPPEGKKSLLISGGLSLFFGPLGLLYAGAWKEAVPAALLWLLAWKILPGFLIGPFFGLIAFLSCFAGFAYAYKFNKTGTRTPLLPKGEDAGK
ncbi:MAG: hypothetical protein CO108_26150 [Deltaproteobacteria bacterium CG_4_9_14_3_um_filter_63_12]|nr:MAG: hypothetical protein CO108_26150 [Deltaproteobacteria bacterium CG_4_9_14_3_um_filter_63_12]